MDPSPATARGVFVGIQAALQHLDGKNDLSGIHVALQGVGHVGMALAGRLHEAGAFLTLADVDADRAAEAAERFGARVVGVDAIHAVEADVFSPCALGGVITHDNLNDLRCRVVAGSANNQLSHQGRGMGLALKQRGILYAPDYVINAGGLIQVGMATLGHDQTATDEKIDRIARTLSGIFAEADARALDTETLTQQLAEKILREPIHD
jgi:leucine dehydrogenase